MMIIILEQDSEQISDTLKSMSKQHALLATKKPEDFHNALLAHQPDAVVVSIEILNKSPFGWSELLLIDRLTTEIILTGDAAALAELETHVDDSVSLVEYPMDPQKMSRLILQKIESKKFTEKQYSIMRTETNYSRLRDHFFNNLLEGHNLPNDITSLMSFLKLTSETAKYYLVFVLSFAPVSNYSPRYDIWEMAIRVKSITHQEISKIAINRSCVREQNQIAFLLLIEEPGDSFKYKLEQTLEIVKKQVLKECKQSISVGIGLASNIISDISYSYQQACDALGQGNFFGKSFLCFFSDLWLRSSRRLQFSQQAKEQIRAHLYRNDFEKMDLLIEKEFQNIGSLGLASKENILSLQIDLTVFLMDISNRMSIIAERPQSYSSILNDFLKSGSLKEMEIVVKKTLRDMSNTSNATQEKRTIRIVQDAQKMIVERINEPVNVQLLAQYIHISPNYLSAVFKEETGMRLSKYINSIKLQKAATLLLETNNSIAQITEAVGYDNANYFSQLFKKQYGMKPSEYRRFHEQESDTNIPE